MKTYIGKISHGFNFLAYYFDDQKILPSQETFRRFHERSLALYEHPPKTNYRRHKKAASGRDISLYQADEVAPNDDTFKNFLITLQTMISHQPDTMKRMRRYLGQWTHWLKLGLSTIKEFATSVETHLPSLFSCWRPGAMESHGLIA